MNRREVYRDKRHDRYDDIHHRNRSYPQRSKRDSSSSSSDQHSKTKSKKHKKNKSNSNRSKSRSRSRSRSRNNDHRKDTSSKYGLSKRDYEKASRRSRSNEGEPPKSEKQLEIEEIKRKIERIKQIRANENSKTSLNDQPRQKNISNKLTEQEKQRRLQEMQENAKWRNDVRSNNVKKYKTDAKYEEKLEEQSKDKNSQAEASNYFKFILFLIFKKG
jgi:hypothetical protein